MYIVQLNCADVVRCLLDPMRKYAVLSSMPGFVWKWDFKLFGHIVRNDFYSDRDTEIRYQQSKHMKKLFSRKNKYVCRHGLSMTHNRIIRFCS